MSNAPWFNEDCAERRRIFYTCLNLYRGGGGDKSNENRINMVNARSQYKTCLRKSRLLYDKSETDKLYKLCCQNARDYWKSSASQSPKSNIPLLKTYAAISNAHLSRVCKRGKLSGSCLTTLNGFGSTQLPIFLCHIDVPTFSSQNN